MTVVTNPKEGECKQKKEQSQAYKKAIIPYVNTELTSLDFVLPNETELSKPETAHIFLCGHICGEIGVRPLLRANKNLLYINKCSQ